GYGLGVLQPEERLAARRQDGAAERARQVERRRVHAQQDPVPGRDPDAVVGEELGVALRQRSHHCPSPSALPRGRPTLKAFVPSATSVPVSSRTSVRTTTTRRPARATVASASSVPPAAGSG